MMYLPICDSCMEQGREEASGHGLSDPEIVQTVLLEMGADIADHLCDRMESGGEIPCRCACQDRRT